MEFTLKLSLDNADAREENGDLNHDALAGYVRAVGDRVEVYETSGTVRDGNGNSIGTFAVTDED